MSKSLPRAVIIDAIHRGIAKAVRRFESWTYGESLSWYGVENVLSVYVAEAIGQSIFENKTNHILTMEQNFQEILTYSGHQNKRGRPSHHYKQFLSGTNNRVDIVVWNAIAQPKSIIEIKRNSTVAGLLVDANRILTFLKFCGKEYGGSVKFGFVACVLEATSDSHMERKILLRTDKFREHFGDGPANLRLHPPRIISRRDRPDRVAKSENQFASIVFEFAAKR